MKDILKNYIKKITAKEVKFARKTQPKDPKKIKEQPSYFKAARSWADDIHTATIVSRNRYKLAFLSMCGLSALLIILISILIPTQHTELVVVHEGDGGYTWLSTTKKDYKPPMNWVRTQSEIAHYVSARESYDPLLYREQSNEVNLLSSPEVQAEYELSQSSDNKVSPINVIGDKGYRTVTINNVLELDSASDNKENNTKSVNLAQVDYVIVDHLFGQNQTIKTQYTALVSWEYTGTSSDPSKLLKDWDGFTITKFVPQPTNINDNNS